MTVPPAAASVARGYLHGAWRQIITEDPGMLGLPSGIDTTGMALGDPFIVFKLADGGLARYTSASNDDPRGFAAIVEYCFPVRLKDGTSAGAIIVTRNRNDVGKKFQPEEGEVTLAGLYRPDSDVMTTIVGLRADDPEACAVEYVDVGQKRFLMRAPDGSLLSGPGEKASFRPISVDAELIRNSVRTFQRLYPQNLHE